MHLDTIISQDDELLLSIFDPTQTRYTVTEREF
jgi:hypothetical protein